MNPNPNSDEYKIKLRNISLGIIVLVSLLVLSGLLGWWSVDAVFFAEDLGISLSSFQWFILPTF